MKERPMISRAVPLIDLDISKGDGRTVTAYAATFDDPYEVNDDHGHYVETINRTAFNRQISHGISRVLPMFNHGLTIWGRPSERDSDPLGELVAVRAEPKGLLSTIRYGRTPRQEEVLTMLKDGTVNAYSFRGTIYRSLSRGRTNSGLQLHERLDLGLKDLGPAINAVNMNAGLVAIRSASLIAEEIAQLTDDERAELLAKLSTPPADEAPGQDSTDGPPAEQAPDTSLQLIALLEAEAANRRRQHGT